MQRLGSLGLPWGSVPPEIGFGIFTVLLKPTVYRPVDKKVL